MPNADADKSRTLVLRDGVLLLRARGARLPRSGDSLQSGVESLERRNHAIARTASQGEPFYGWNAARVLVNRSTSDGLVASMPRCTRVLSLLPLLLWCAEHTVSGEPRSNPREHDRGARPWSRQRCGGKAPGNRADIVTRWGSTIDPAVAAPLPEYPRPQLARHESTWLNLNGLWQWEPTTGTNGTASPPPFGRSLNRTILVPFPAESCLSGIGENHPYQWYRTTFDGSKAFAGENSLIHFGAVDWYSTVYLNTVRLGDHKGGYDAFSFNSSAIRPGENELLVFVYDPSELGGQPFGKRALRQRN